MKAEAIARALGGYKRSGKNHLCRCPIHADRSPSLSLADTNDNRLLVKCFAGCDGANVLRHLKAHGFLESVTPEQPYMPRTEPRRPVEPDVSRDWSTKAESILQCRLPLKGSPAEKYLESRNCEVPECEALGFLPVINRPGFPRLCAQFPSFLAIITDVISAKPISLHFTFLTSNGAGKAPVEKHEQRHLLAGHRKSGGVIRLVDDECVSNGLGIAEGIETALSVMKGGWRPVWSCIDAGNLGSFPVLNGVECLTIFADNDPAGIKAAEQCAERWQAAGKEVRSVLPQTYKTDWNDVALVGGR
jgi:putative DNA primase/helicase